MTRGGMTRGGMTRGGMTRDGMTRRRRAYVPGRALQRRHGTTYFWATQVLPRAQRRHVYAFYGFCRYADEIVDGGGPPAVRAKALAALQSDFERAWAGRRPGHAVLTALVATMKQLGHGPDLVERFLRSMAMDLCVSGYDTWEGLCAYMDGSAAVIGEMMVPVLCPAAGPGTWAAARHLGVAFQMTNFLRDVGEDLDRGRVYVPAEDLRRFGADPWAREITPSWEALMRFEIGRTRDLYRLAAPGIERLPPRAAACARTAAVLYEGILGQIEANRYDVFKHRARVALPVKVATMAKNMLVNPTSGAKRPEWATSST